MAASGFRPHSVVSNPAIRVASLAGSLQVVTDSDFLTWLDVIYIFYRLTRVEYPF